MTVCAKCISNKWTCANCTLICGGPASLPPIDFFFFFFPPLGPEWVTHSTTLTFNVCVRVFWNWTSDVWWLSIFCSASSSVAVPGRVARVEQPNLPGTQLFLAPCHFLSCFIRLPHMHCTFHGIEPQIRQLKLYYNSLYCLCMINLNFDILKEPLKSEFPIFPPPPTSMLAVMTCSLFGPRQLWLSVTRKYCLSHAEECGILQTCCGTCDKSALPVWWLKEKHLIDGLEKTITIKPVWLLEKSKHCGVGQMWSSARSHWPGRNLEQTVLTCSCVSEVMAKVHSMW